MLRLLIFFNFICWLCANSQGKTIYPPGLINQTKEESEYLNYHKCHDAGEIYGAAYFVTKEHMLLQDTNYSLDWVNCEMASFIMYNKSASHNNGGQGVQSLDVLDFSAIHLSAYERLHRRWQKKLRLSPTINTIAEMKRVTSVLFNQSNSISRESVSSGRLSRTLAVMPFLGTGMGAGHSVLENRFEYLRACFWSVYQHIPHIVVGVMSEEDYNFTRFHSGLPFFDVVLAPSLPKPAALPVSTVQQVRDRLRSGRYDFDHVYFTESDQVLLLRRPMEIFRILDAHPRYVVTPHRLMPYPEEVALARLARASPPPSIGGDPLFAWRTASCCMARQNCKRKETRRRHWISVSDRSVPLINVYGLLVPLGNSNFLDELYHACTLHSGDGGRGGLQDEGYVCP